VGAKIKSAGVGGEKKAKLGATANLEVKSIKEDTTGSLNLVEKQRKSGFV